MSRIHQKIGTLHQNEAVDWMLQITRLFLTNQSVLFSHSIYPASEFVYDVKHET